MSLFAHNILPFFEGALQLAPLKLPYSVLHSLHFLKEQITLHPRYNVPPGIHGKSTL